MAAHRKSEEPDLRDYKDLSVEELSCGFYTQSNGDCACIFCGEAFQEGVVYQSRGRGVTHKRAVQEHIEDAHSGAFWPMVGLEKSLSGLSDVQKSLLTCLYEQKSTDQICEVMSISAATVRTHRFNLQKAKREAKILLAILELIEGGGDPLPRPTGDAEEAPAATPDSLFSLNALHPFFTQFRYK